MNRRSFLGQLAGMLAAGVAPGFLPGTGRVWKQMGGLWTVSYHSRKKTGWDMVRIFRPSDDPVLISLLSARRDVLPHSFRTVATLKTLQPDGPDGWEAEIVSLHELSQPLFPLIDESIEKLMPWQ